MIPDRTTESVASKLRGEFKKWSRRGLMDTKGLPSCGHSRQKFGGGVVRRGLFSIETKGGWKGSRTNSPSKKKSSRGKKTKKFQKGSEGNVLSRRKTKLRERSEILSSNDEMSFEPGDQTARQETAQGKNSKMLRKRGGYC